MQCNYYMDYMAIFIVLLHTEPNTIHQQLLQDASFFLTQEHLADHVTIQLEEHDITMEYCNKCKNRTL